MRRGALDRALGVAGGTAPLVFEVALLALACAGAPASKPVATEVRPPSGEERPRTTFVTKLYELVLEAPAPIWASTPEAAARSHFSRKQEGRQFMIQQIPGEESPADWKRLFAVYALFIENGRFESFRVVALRIWSSACGQEHLALHSITEEPAHWQVLVLCESSPNGSAAAGWGKDVGAITLMDAQRVSNTYVRVHHTWRGKRFDRANRATWPVTQDEIHGLIERFARIRLSYHPDAAEVRYPILGIDPDFPNRDFDSN